MLSIASNVHDSKKTGMDVRKSSIWGVVGLIYFTKRKTSELRTIDEGDKSRLWVLTIMGNTCAAK